MARVPNCHRRSIPGPTPGAVRVSQELHGGGGYFTEQWWRGDSPNVGDGAFYGPKVAFNFRDVLKREWTLSTIQFDCG